MSRPSKKDYFPALASRYQKAARNEKSQILKEFCANTGYHIKHAIRKLSTFKLTRRPKLKNKRGPKSKYNLSEILKPLREIWIASHLPCSKRLKTILPLWLSSYQELRGTLALEILKKLLKISPATIERILKPIKHLYRGKGRSATKPGLLLRHHILIKTNQWDEFRPGFLEADTVHHCGTSLAGHYAVTLDTVDIATSWSEQRATYGIGHKDIFLQLKNIEKSLPFPLLGLDCDNGKELMNQNIYRYLTHRKAPVQFTRSREYYKNDNAHVEGKNWTHVRQWLGYRRFEDPLIVDLLNDLYKNEWRLFQNFFLPSVKLQTKERIGSRIIKKHDDPKTPYQRVLDSKFVLPHTKRCFKELYKTLNPFKLREIIDKKIAIIHKLAR